MAMWSMGSAEPSWKLRHPRQPRRKSTSDPGVLRLRPPLFSPTRFFFFLHSHYFQPAFPFSPFFSIPISRYSQWAITCFLSSNLFISSASILTVTISAAKFIALPSRLLHPFVYKLSPKSTLRFFAYQVEACRRCNQFIIEQSSCDKQYLEVLDETRA